MLTTALYDYRKVEEESRRSRPRFYSRMGFPEDLYAFRSVHESALKKLTKTLTEDVAAQRSHIEKSVVEDFWQLRASNK